MRNAPVVLVLVLVLAVAAPAVAQDLDLGKFADLETLVQRVEQEGFKRFTFEAVRPKLPDASLAISVQGNTIEKEKALHRAWIAAYDAITKDTVERGRAAAKEKKSPGAKEAYRLLATILPRAAELKGGFDEEKTFEDRQRNLQKFLRRYDFGPKIAQATADGTAVINVRLAPDTYEVVRRHVYSWKFQPLKDAAGADVKVGLKRVEFTEALSMNEVREALRFLTNEWFAVRYAKWEKEQETDVLRVTGAKLLFGTYYFLEHEDRLVVAREPAAK